MNKVSIFFQETQGGLLSRELLEGVYNKENSVKGGKGEYVMKTLISDEKYTNKLIFTIEEGNGC